MTVILGWPTFADACPTCQAGLAESANLQLAYALSIVVMMVAPFLILSAWVVAIWRITIRGARPFVVLPRDENAGGPRSVLPDPRNS